MKYPDCFLSCIKPDDFLQVALVLLLFKAVEPEFSSLDEQNETPSSQPSQEESIPGREEVMGLFC